MAFLDNIDKKITLLGQSAIQKTKEVSDTAKATSAIKNLESQKKEYYIALGESFYNKHISEADEQERELIGKIKMCDFEIQQLQEQIQKIKGTVSCPNCNAEIPVNAAFCSVCGTKIERMEVVTQKTCSVCGAVVEEGQIFCVNCGNKLANVSFNEE